MNPGTPLTPAHPTQGASPPVLQNVQGRWRTNRPGPRLTVKNPGGGLLGELRSGDLTLLHWVLAALLLISIGRVHDHIVLLATLRPGVVLSALCILIALVKPTSLRLDNVLSAWPAKAIIALAGAAVLSSIFGLSLGASGTFLLERMAPVMVLFFLVTLCFRTANDIRWIVIAYLLATISVFYASIFLSDVMHFGGYTRQGGAGMYDGNDIGVVYMVGLPLAVVLLRSRTRALQVLGAFTVLGIVTSLVLSASRGGFLGLIGGGLTVVLVSRGWSLAQKVIVVALPVLGMLLFAPDGYWDQMGSILNPQEDYNLTSDTGRMAIWTRGLGYVAQYPLFGVGPDNFIRAGWLISDVGQAGIFGASIRDQAPHNTFLQVWAELGSVGLGIWMAILTYGTLAPLRLRRQMPHWWLNGGSADQRLLYLLAGYLPASFVGFGITTFFVSHAYTPIFYSLTAILAGLMVIGRQNIRDSRNSALAAFPINGLKPAGQRSQRFDFGAPIPSTKQFTSLPPIARR